MKKKIPLIGLLSALLCIGLLSGPALAQSSVHIHFFVVPSQPAAGVNYWDAMEALRAKLVELAGGYTELGPSNGGSEGSGGTINKEYNFSFLASAPRDITSDLEEFIPKYFDISLPFILHWTGDCSFPASR